MEFKIDQKANPQAQRYSTKELDIAREFSKKIHKEFGSFVKAVVLFGSSAREKKKKKGDIDILVIVNDLTISLTREAVQTYRVIMERLVSETSKDIHLTTMKMTNFYEYIRAGDPVGINILRDGVAIIDTGFFDPMQALLYQGRIRPTYESIWTYMNRSPNTIFNSKWHVLQASLDLYWAVIDAAHAALMSVGQIPPTPEHVSDFIREKLVKPKLIPAKYDKVMDKFYKLSKGIIHRQISTITGKQYDAYLKEAEDFIHVMRTLVKKEQKKKLGF